MVLSLLQPQHGLNYGIGYYVPQRMRSEKPTATRILPLHARNLLINQGSTMNVNSVLLSVFRPRICIRRIDIVRTRSIQCCGREVARRCANTPDRDADLEKTGRREHNYRTPRPVCPSWQRAFSLAELSDNWYTRQGQQASKSTEQRK